MWADGTSGTDRYSGYLSYNHSSNFMRFATAGSERMRIDLSGNLLVGTTSTDPNSTAGAQLSSVGRVLGTVDGSNAGYFNRLTSDGEIVRFEKDGTTVGSIGVLTTNAYFANGDVSLAVNGTYDVIHPRDGNGDRRSDAIDLGGTIDRFKDLYLSGGVYLGGTGAANKLDDYEEGTWTPAFSASTTAPTIAYSSASGTYVKVGAYVYCEFVLILSSFSGGSGHVTFTGLPFSAENNDNRSGVCVSFSAAFANGCNGVLINGGSATSGVLRRLDANNNLSQTIDVSELNGNEILRGSISYKAT